MHFPSSSSSAGTAPADDLQIGARSCRRRAVDILAIDDDALSARSEHAAGLAARVHHRVSCGGLVLGLRAACYRYPRASALVVAPDMPGSGKIKRGRPDPDRRSYHSCRTAARYLFRDRSAPAHRYRLRRRVADPRASFASMMATGRSIIACLSHSPPIGSRIPMILACDRVSPLRPLSASAARTRARSSGAHAASPQRLLMLIGDPDYYGRSSARLGADRNGGCRGRSNRTVCSLSAVDTDAPERRPRRRYRPTALAGPRGPTVTLCHANQPDLSAIAADIRPLPRAESSAGDKLIPTLGHSGCVSPARTWHQRSRSPAPRWCGCFRPPAPRDDGAMSGHPRRKARLASRTRPSSRSR